MYVSCLIPLVAFNLVPVSSPLEGWDCAVNLSTTQPIEKLATLLSPVFLMIALLLPSETPGQRGCDKIGALCTFRDCLPWKPDSWIIRSWIIYSILGHVILLLVRKCLCTFSWMQKSVGNIKLPLFVLDLDVYSWKMFGLMKSDVSKSRKNLCRVEKFCVTVWAQIPLQQSSSGFAAFPFEDSVLKCLVRCYLLASIFHCQVPSMSSGDGMYHCKIKHHNVGIDMNVIFVFKLYLKSWWNKEWPFHYC